MSTVLHHFEDLDTAAAEAARVLAPGGVVLVRSSFPDQQSGDSYPSRFFPSAARVRTRADSLLREVGDDEFAAGLRRLRGWAEVAPGEPVVFRPDLRVFEQGLAKLGR